MEKIPSPPGFLSQIRGYWTSNCIGRHKAQIARILEEKCVQIPENWSRKYDYLLSPDDLVRMYQDVNCCIEEYGRDNIGFVAGLCLERVGTNGKKEVYLVQNVTKFQTIGPHYPGGSCESGEGLVDGLVREVHEETDIGLQEAFGLGELQYNSYHVDLSHGKNLVVFDFTPKNLSRKKLDELVSHMTFEYGEEEEGWWENDILSHPAVPRIPGQTFDKFRHLGRKSPFTNLLTLEEQREDLQNGCPREYALYRAYADGITHIVNAYVGITEANKNKPESWNLSNYYDYEKLDTLIPDGIRIIENVLNKLLPNHPKIDEFLNELFIPNFRKRVIERIVELGRLRDVHLRKLHKLGQNETLYCDFSDFVLAVNSGVGKFDPNQFMYGDVSAAHADLGRHIRVKEQFILQLVQRSGIALDGDLSQYKIGDIQESGEREGEVIEFSLERRVKAEDKNDPDHDPMIGFCGPWGIKERTVICTIRIFPDFHFDVSKKIDDFLW